MKTDHDGSAGVAVAVAARGCVTQPIVESTMLQVLSRHPDQELLDRCAELPALHAAARRFDAESMRLYQKACEDTLPSKALRIRKTDRAVLAIAGLQGSEFFDDTHTHFNGWALARVLEHPIEQFSPQQRRRIDTLRAAKGEWDRRITMMEEKNGCTAAERAYYDAREAFQVAAKAVHHSRARTREGLEAKFKALALMCTEPREAIDDLFDFDAPFDGIAGSIVRDMLHQYKMGVPTFR